MGGSKYKEKFMQGKIERKKFMQLENPPPPHNFYNGPSLTPWRRTERAGAAFPMWRERAELHDIDNLFCN